MQQRWKALTSILLSGTVAAACSSPRVVDPTSSVATITYPTSAAARSLLNTAVSYAQAHDYDGLCRAVAASPDNCRGLLQSAKAMRLEAGHSSPRVTEELHAAEASGHPTLVLRLTGTHDDGSPYTSDFAVIDDGAGLVKSLTPVYWSGVKFSSN
jgi:hypothetical protein